MKVDFGIAGVLRSGNGRAPSGCAPTVRKVVEAIESDDLLRRPLLSVRRSRQTRVTHVIALASS